MKVGVIGAVGSTALTIKKLLAHGAKISGVLGHEPKLKGRVSGLNDLRSLCFELNLDYKPYTNINNIELIQWFKEMDLDVIFAVGFSQLLKEEWFKIAKKGCIGFHPTRLPNGRGRAPIAWMILKKESGAATFFKMGLGTDDGPIYIQEFFELDESDDVESLLPKIQNAICTALDKLIPNLLAGNWDVIAQNEMEATYYAKRDPIDGFINWHLSAIEIDRLIKATTNPYPGAFSFFRGKIVKIWKSEIEEKNKITGVTGRVLSINENEEYLIQCGDGCIWIKKITIYSDEKLKIGDYLGGEIPFDKIDFINRELINI